MGKPIKIVLEPTLSSSTRKKFDIGMTPK